MPVPKGHLHFHFLGSSILAGQGRAGVRSSALGMLVTKIFQRIFVYVRRLPLKQKRRKAVMREGEWEMWDKLSGARFLLLRGRNLCRD